MANIKLLITALTLATSKIGVKEQTGNNDGPFIDECLKLCGLDNQAQIKATGKGFAWCAALVSWVMVRAGVGVKNAWAPAWFPESRLVRDGKYQPMDVAAINWRGIENGHVFFLIHWPEEGDTCITLEGNWNQKCDLNERKKSEINAVARWI
jgi:hypothetical protein